jgi:outer membrane protein assembly factor BamB
MTNVPADESSARIPLRLWPGVLLVIAQWLLWYGMGAVLPGAGGMIGGAVCALALLVWWLFFSRAPWPERVGAIVLMIVAMGATKFIVHESIAGAGMGVLLYISAVPGLCLALVGWAAVTRRVSDGARRALLVVAILLACAPWVLLRTAGIIGGAGSELHWRWTPTPEQRLLAGPSDEPKPIPRVPDGPLTETRDKVKESGTPKTSDQAAIPTPSTTAAAESAHGSTSEAPAEWPGFRGPDRDGVIRGVRINTDWSTTPPVVIWRRPIGPGWSSFAVRRDLLYTQEQRGDDEIVASYKVTTGEPVWRHRDGVRFWESNGGAGPRATPTLSNGRVYTFGATGILNALDARSGAVIWSHNVASDTHTTVPMWGFASSPLVVDDVVIVAADATLVAYDTATGHRRWVGPAHRGSYSSPHPTKIDGVVQVLLLGGPGATSVAPADGTVLWEYAWPGAAIVQPAVTGDGDIVINTIAGTGGIGTRRLSVAHGPEGWAVKERWTSSGLKPYYNDFVLHKGYAFGFDGSILSCIDLADGTRKWKGGRYGNGQLVLLPDQDLLLVQSEEGELALVGATADEFREIARFRALDGKTWNHPVLVGDVLLVRNGEEMAAFRVSLGK